MHHKWNEMSTKPTLVISVMFLAIQNNIVTTSCKTNAEQNCQINMIEYID